MHQADKWTGSNVTLVTSTDSVHLPMVLQVSSLVMSPVRVFVTTLWSLSLSIICKYNTKQTTKNS